MLIFSRYSWWLGAMAGLALFLAAANQVGLLTPFQGLFLSVTAPVESGLRAVFGPTASFLSDAGSIDDLREENRRLRLENEELQHDIVGLEQARARVAELEEALKIPSGAAFGERLAANIVHRDASAFTDVVSIDKGKNDGVRAGMVVVSSKGTLMGTVTEALDKQSFVRLITDSRSRVAAQVQDSKADGIIKGTANRQLAFDLAQAEINVGDTITTSSLTGRYPEGIPIGKVTEVGGTPQDTYRKVSVEPFVRMSTATAVLILTEFTPRSLVGTEP